MADEFIRHTICMDNPYILGINRPYILIILIIKKNIETEMTVNIYFLITQSNVVLKSTTELNFKIFWNVNYFLYTDGSSDCTEVPVAAAEVGSEVTGHGCSCRRRPPLLLLLTMPVS